MIFKYDRNAIIVIKSTNVKSISLVSITFCKILSVKCRLRVSIHGVIVQLYCLSLVQRAWKWCRLASATRHRSLSMPTSTSTPTAASGPCRSVASCRCAIVNVTRRACVTLIDNCMNKLSHTNWNSSLFHIRTRPTDCFINHYVHHARLLRFTA